MNTEKAQMKLKTHGQHPTAKGRADMPERIMGRGNGRCRGNPKAPDVEPAQGAPTADAETEGPTRNSGSGSCWGSARADYSAASPRSAQSCQWTCRSEKRCTPGAHHRHGHEAMQLLVEPFCDMAHISCHGSPLADLSDPKVLCNNRCANGALKPNVGVVALLSCSHTATAQRVYPQERRNIPAAAVKKKHIAPTKQRQPAS